MSALVSATKKEHVYVFSHYPIQLHAEGNSNPNLVPELVPELVPGQAPIACTTAARKLPQKAQEGSKMAPLGGRVFEKFSVDRSLWDVHTEFPEELWAHSCQSNQNNAKKGPKWCHCGIKFPSDLVWTAHAGRSTPNSLNKLKADLPKSPK